MSNDRCYTIINTAGDHMCIIASNRFQARRIARDYWAFLEKPIKIVSIKVDVSNGKITK